MIHTILKLLKYISLATQLLCQHDVIRKKYLVKYENHHIIIKRHSIIK